MISLNDAQKVQVLLVELQERYNASHKMRERSTKFTLWLSGMAIGLAWLLIYRTGFPLTQRIALTLLIAALFIGMLVFIMGLQKGFQKNREAIIRSERALGMHAPGVYLKETTLLPAEYNQTSTRLGDHFCTLCIWLVVVTLSLLILTWTCPEVKTPSISPAKLQQTKGGQ